MRPFVRLAALIVVACVSFVVDTAKARLTPYYVVTGRSATQPKPRVLIMLDTSGSMEWIAGASIRCTWHECEKAGDPLESRISIARRAIRTVVEASSDRIDYALMSFRHWAPPTVAPDHCNAPASGLRFQWTENYWWAGDTLADRKPIPAYPGLTGMWSLCGNWYYTGSTRATPKREAYAYLRWDEVLAFGPGGAALTNNMGGAVPPSPLVTTDPVQIKNPANHFRKVQWFDDFYGVRMQGDTAKSAASVGDYSAAEIDGHDFYFVPYAFGWGGYGVTNMDVVNNGYTIWDNRTKGGYQTGDIDQTSASLHQPFYLPATAISASPLTSATRGPSTEADALLGVRRRTSTLIEGGLDLGGGTPWASAIGDIPATTTWDNSSGSHLTVASYVKLLAATGVGEVCRPLSIVMLSDGVPDTGEGGALLHQRLAALRNTLGARVFVGGLFQGGWVGALNDMACAGAGACDGACATPCDDTPRNAWDTCDDPSNPGNSCAYFANTEASLVDALLRIADSLVVDLPSGPATTLNDFSTADPRKADDLVRTSLRAWTEWPARKGHVVREVCDDKDPADPTKLAPWCDDPDVFHDTQEASEPTFGPCPRSRSWDAGECLRATNWDDRRLLISRSKPTDLNAVKGAVSVKAGDATAVFLKHELIAQGFVVADGTEQQVSDDVAKFILGGYSEDGWKLPGLAGSSPVAVRRIPKPTPGSVPEVALRDPHCAGRAVDEQTSVPQSLIDFATDAWDPPSYVPNEGLHRPYQEVVLIGDDMGILHAFHLNTGNEMWALIPYHAVPTIWDQYLVFTKQKEEPDPEHRYGMAGTVVQGWAYDNAASKWRHLAFVTMGAGGTEFMMLDVTSASRHAGAVGLPSVEVLWTSLDPLLAPTYQAFNGETWSAPAFSYHVPNDSQGSEPTAFIVTGTGYARDTSIKMNNGRGMPGHVLMFIDALTGQVLEDAKASFPGPAGTYGEMGEVTTGSDVAMASHCKSRFWAEMQEAYHVDTSGRIHRWDFGGYGTGQHHAGDSNTTDPTQPWTYYTRFGARMRACQGTGATCAVLGSKYEAFHFSPAVTALDRLDPFAMVANGPHVPTRPDEFLLAVASGHPDDTATDASSDFHSSLYLLVDDHGSQSHLGFSVPAGSPKVQPTTGAAGTRAYPHYFRAALSDLTRTRVYQPFPGAPSYTETTTFSRLARPTRAPRIAVRPILGSNGEELAEAFTITYSVYEPGRDDCDSRWYESAKQLWHTDPGSSYRVTYQLAADGSGFDFQAGATSVPASEFPRGLTFVGVEQVLDGDCADGTCGPRADIPAQQPCPSEPVAIGDEPAVRSLPVSVTDRRGFRAVEG